MHIHLQSQRRATTRGSIHIAKLPENVDIDEIMYRLYVLDKIRKGQEAALVWSGMVG